MFTRTVGGGGGRRRWWRMDGWQRRAPELRCSSTTTTTQLSSSSYSSTVTVSDRGPHIAAIGRRHPPTRPDTSCALPLTLGTYGFHRLCLLLLPLSSIETLGATEARVD
ncbi:uncharacterized protein [Palaemon carinicauda]|uniref:uncharacterized protein n=1 Tax=Palaemon carinicauda TaxID=392227 RepID=UPI0035B59A73